MKRCPYCAEEIQDAAIVCRFCGRDLQAGVPARQSPPPPGSPPLPQATPPQNESASKTDFGFLLIGIPLLAAILALFWVGNMNLLEGPSSKLGLLAVVTVVATAALAAKEASDLKMHEPVDVKGKKGTRATSWFIGLLVLWVVAYPMYLFQRRRFGRTNLLVPGLVVALLFVGSVAGMSAAISDRQQELENILSNF